VPPADDAGLAVGLCRLLSDEGLRQRLAAAGQAKVQAYSWRKVSRRILDFYQEAIQSARRDDYSFAPMPLTPLPHPA
jgi:glycosyltransferase involved in cell wall biosynthesis